MPTVAPIEQAALLKLIILLVALYAGRWPGPAPADRHAVDFERFVELVPQHYAYLDQRATDWDRVREKYAAELSSIRSDAAFIGLLERALGELYDHHAHLGTNTRESPPMVPSQADLWAVWKGGQARIEAVRHGSAAERAGVAVGMVALSIDGLSASAATARLAPTCLSRPDARARDYALRIALAGRRGQPRKLVLSTGSEERELVLEPVDTGRPSEPLSFRRLALADDNRLSGGEAGLIRFHDSLGDQRCVAEFDRALAELRDTSGLILDLRDTPSGGNTLVARGLMGRLIETEGAYQKHSLPLERVRTGIARSWLELVAPRGPFTYRGPIVVLVNRWTGSMGEGLAIGLHGLQRAVVVGTPMAGLLGAIRSFELPETGIPVRFPVERLFHVDGTPREDFVPDVLVDASSEQFDALADPTLALGRARLSLLVGADSSR